MNILREAQRTLSETFMHYVCMRLRFHAAVWRDDEGASKAPLSTDDCQCCPAP